MSSRWNCVCECDGKWKEMWHEGSAHCSTAAFGAALGILIMRHTRLCPGDSRDGWLPLLSLPATAATAATAASAAGSKQVEAALSLKFPQKLFLLFCTYKADFPTLSLLLLRSHATLCGIFKFALRAKISTRRRALQFAAARTLPAKATWHAAQVNQLLFSSRREQMPQRSISSSSSRANCSS